VMVAAVIATETAIAEGNLNRAVLPPEETATATVMIVLAEILAAEVEGIAIPPLLHSGKGTVIHHLHLVLPRLSMNTPLL